jgi:hypothetical protein
MSPAKLKGVGVGCLVVSAILLLVAWDRYQDNANKRDAINRIVGPSPWGALAPLYGVNVEPGVPEATRYALFFAVLIGVGGVVCIVMSPKMGAAKSSQRATPPGQPLG